MTYVILPMQPTPNGRLHIGHAAGTYLRADVLARSLRADGHDVRVACGTDAYENWVLATAAHERRAPEDVCAAYHQGITTDLEGLGIQLDAWVDPLSDEHREPYVDLHREMFAEVTASSAASWCSERVPYADDGSPLIGTFIAGDCPSCGAPAGGSSCTACGDHFQPDQLVNPRARLSDTTIGWRQERSWFLEPTSGPDLVAALRTTGLAERHVAVVERYLNRTGGRARLSGPGRWGVPEPRLGAGHVLSNSYFLYCLYAARRAAHGTDLRPFERSSSTVTVGVFGSDNSIPGLLVPGLYSQATSGRLRAFDHTVVNGMLDLDGQKCSTSKRYGIWLEDILPSGIVTADELRYALCGVDLDSGRSNLELTRLASDATWFRRAVAERVTSAPVAGGDIDHDLVSVQRRLLRPERLDLPSARAVLAEHLTAPFTDQGRWLATLAALADPIAPGLSRAIRTGGTLAGIVGHGDVRVAALGAIVRRGDDRS